MNIFFLGFCFPFGFLVFMIWISGDWHYCWSSRESVPNLGVGLLQVSLAFGTKWAIWLVWPTLVLLTSMICTWAQKFNQAAVACLCSNCCSLYLKSKILRGFEDSPSSKTCNEWYWMYVFGLSSRSLLGLGHFTVLDLVMSWEWVGCGKDLWGTESTGGGSSDDRQLIHRCWLVWPVFEWQKPDGIEGRAKQWVCTKLGWQGPQEGSWGTESQHSELMSVWGCTHI